jgi:hypothetical protein
VGREETMVRGPSRTTYYRSRGTLLELGYVEQVMNKYFVKKPCKSGVPLVPRDYHGTNGTNQAAPVVDPVPSAFISYVQRTALSVLLYIRNGAPTKEVRGVDTERDISKGEAVEHELTAMIERRHDRRVVEEGERPAEGAWGASERRYFARLEEQRRRQRLAYHEEQAARPGHTLGAYHEAEARKYGCGTTEGAPWTIGSLRVYYRLPTSPTS